MRTPASGWPAEFVMRPCTAPAACRVNATVGLADAVTLMPNVPFVVQSSRYPVAGSPAGVAPEYARAQTAELGLGPGGTGRPEIVAVPSASVITLAARPTSFPVAKSGSRVQSESGPQDEITATSTPDTA